MALRNALSRYLNMVQAEKPLGRVIYYLLNRTRSLMGEFRHGKPHDFAHDIQRHPTG